MPVVSGAYDPALDAFRVAQIGSGVGAKSLNLPGAAVDLAGECVVGPVARAELGPSDGLQGSVVGHLQEGEEVLIVSIGVAMRLESQRQE